MCPLAMFTGNQEATETKAAEVLQSDCEPESTARDAFEARRTSAKIVMRTSGAHVPPEESEMYVQSKKQAVSTEEGQIEQDAWFILEPSVGEYLMKSIDEILALGTSDKKHD